MSAQEPPREPPEEPTRPTEPLRGPLPPASPPRRTQPDGGPAEGPPYEPERKQPWWASPGGVFAIVLIALLLGGGVGYAIGHSGESTSPATTHTQTTTVTTPEVHTVTSKTVTQAPPNHANEERRVEAESKVRKLERENEELKHQSEAGV